MQFLSIEQVCRILGAPEDDVKKMISDGRLREVRDAGKRLYRAEDVERIKLRDELCDEPLQLLPFRYEAMNAAGHNVDGDLEAESSEAAVAKIRSQGLFPTRVRRMARKFEDLPIKFRDPTDSGSGLIDMNRDPDSGLIDINDIDINEPMSETDRLNNEAKRLLARAKRMNAVSTVLMCIAILALFFGAISAIK